MKNLDSEGIALALSLQLLLSPCLLAGILKHSAVFLLYVDCVDLWKSLVYNYSVKILQGRYLNLDISLL